MPDVQGFLTKKAGPLPVWGWAAIGGGLVSVLYLRGRGQSAAPAGAAASDGSGQGLFAPSPIIVTPGAMPGGTSSGNPGPPLPSTTPSVIAGSANPALKEGEYGGIFIPLYNAQMRRIGLIPFGTRLMVSGAAIGTPGYTLIPVSYLGQQGFVSSTDITGGSGGDGMGAGGASAVVRTLPGAGKVGRFGSKHAHPQFLNVGMGGGGRSGLRAISQRTGLPEARLMALNPGHWRPTPGGRPRHIHIR